MNVNSHRSLREKKKLVYWDQGVTERELLKMFTVTVGREGK